MSASPTVVRFPPLPASADGGPLATSAPLSELATANRQRDALYELSEQLHRAGSAETIYSAAFTAIETALNCDRSSILLFDASGTMQFVAWHGLSPGYRAAVAGHSPWSKEDADAVPIAIPDIAAADLDATLKATILAEDIQAAAFIPLVVDGRLIGKFMAYFRQTYAFTGEDLAVALAIARQLGFAIQRQRSQAELAEELAATRCLQQLSLEIAHEADLDGLYEKLVEAAQLIMRSDFASMQEYHPNRGPRGELKLLAFIGFSPSAAKLWTWVNADSRCTCGVAYRTLKRVFASDVEKTDFLTGSRDLEGYLETGIRAVQSTPLLARNGQLVGMISTHWRQPHESSERDLRLFDILARLAADLIERKFHEQDLRRREERSRTLTQLLTDVPWAARSDGAFESLQPAWENYTGQSWDAHAGHGWFEAIHADDRDAVRASWASACFEARPYEFSARLWHAPSKQYRHCIIRATPILNEDGSLREWVGACMDVHAKREDQPSRPSGD
ncbi:MAG TPA: GAF domain-containing protein [Steroidobacteraceae bacterium]|nr:GAF domain-containing protein [Steroidobacteraceae bacterium]